MSDKELSSELSLRIKTGFLVAAGIAALVYTPTFVVGIFVLVLAFIGAHELTKMLTKGNKKNSVKIPQWFLPGTAVFMGFGSLMGESGLHATLLFSIVIWIFYELIFTPKNELSNLSSLGFGLFGMIWAVWSILHVTLIKFLPEGSNLLFFLILVISFSDIIAYFGGKHFGKSLLAPSISPKKTWEGSIFGIIGGGLIGTVFVEHIMSMFWLKGLLLSVVLAIIGQLSDLVESKIKRLCNVKDSGSLLPGHGGILDRIDGYLLAAPVFYYFLKI